MDMAASIVRILVQRQGNYRKKERIKDMDNVTGNCTSTKANITVKAVFDGNQSGQQAFMKLIRRKFCMSSTENSGADVGGTTVGQELCLFPFLQPFPAGGNG